MFGSSGPPKDAERSMSVPSALTPTDDSDKGDPPRSMSHTPTSSGEATSPATSPARNSTDEGSGNGTPTEKKRRSSGFGRATTALFNSAKNSLHLTHNSQPSDPPPTAQQTALQKLGKTDAALSVPQGSHNNSAGESRPGPRSTFLVGVTEDKNKKCRRTMEDTHAYLYNFLSTPAPVIGDVTPPSESKNGDDEDDEDEGPMGEKVEGNSSAPSHTQPGMSDVEETDNGYFAIFDGHAGTFAADWCGKKLHVLLEENIRANPNSAIPELLDLTFTTVDAQLQKLPLKNSGCTAICAVLRWEDRIPNPQSATGSTAIAPIAAAVAKAHDSSADPSDLSPLIPHSISTLPPNVTPSTALPKLQETAQRQRVLYTANVGDARIVLCRNGKALRLSYDHKGSDEHEGKRITSAGGLILNNRVNGVLAVTRALGDAYMKELVTGHPYTTETVIQPDVDEFLILACDGLWDVCSDQDAVDLIRSTQDPQLASKQLVEHALTRFSTDNLSCMVVRFDTEALKQAMSQKSEPIGVEGDPSSKVGGVSETDALVREARKSLSLGDGHHPHLEQHLAKVKEDIIKEEEEGAEAGKKAGAEAAAKS